MGICEAGRGRLYTLLTPGLCPPHPVTLTMQLYSSSSISFTFRQYDCVGQVRPGCQWLHLLDDHPDVPSSPRPHATQGSSHARPPRLPAGISRDPSGRGWQQCSGAQSVEHIIQTGPCLGQPRAGWQQMGEGTHLGGRGGRGLEDFKLLGKNHKFSSFGVFPTPTQFSFSSLLQIVNGVVGIHFEH